MSSCFATVFFSLQQKILIVHVPRTVDSTIITVVSTTIPVVSTNIIVVSTIITVVSTNIIVVSNIITVVSTILLYLYTQGENTYILFFIIVY